MANEFEKETRNYGYIRKNQTLSVADAKTRCDALRVKFKTDEFINPSEMREFDALRFALQGCDNPVNNISEVTF